MRGEYASHMSPICNEQERRSVLWHALSLVPRGIAAILSPPFPTPVCGRSGWLRFTGTEGICEAWTWELSLGQKCGGKC